MALVLVGSVCQTDRILNSKGMTYEATVQYGWSFKYII